MPVHEHFEQLCALAIIGDLREQEWSELDEHMQGCPDCRSSFSSFEELYSMLADAADIQSTSPAPKGMTRRFLARARDAGIPLIASPARPVTRPSPIWPPQRRRIGVLYAAPAIVVFVIGAFVLGLQFGLKRNPSSQAATASPQMVTVPAQNTSEALNDNGRLKEQVRKLQEQMRTITPELEEKKRALEVAKNEASALVSQVTELQASNSALKENETHRGAEITQRQADLDQARARENDISAALLADQETLAKLSRELRVTQDLNASLNEAHELIVDRNVHVLNVFPEVDESAKSMQPRGRIFYAEGKKLVFYAYDLANSGKISAKASFYLWGEMSKVQQLVSLGKFQIDSEEQGRWVLRVTDPRLLANVSSVFVTLEPDKGVVTKPSGKRMLSRLLQWKSDNH